PSFLSCTRPACSSTSRCFRTAGSETVKGAASSVTVAGLSARRARIARRVACESAPNVPSSEYLTIWFSSAPDASFVKPEGAKATRSCVRGRAGCPGFEHRTTIFGRNPAVFPELRRWNPYCRYVYPKAMRDILHDLRYACRTLRNSPVFSIVAVLTVALGVGANAAVFSLINAVLLRPLPYFQPDRLVLGWEGAPSCGRRDSPVAPANYADGKNRSRSFEEMGALEDHSYRLIGEGTPEVVEGSLVTAGLLRVLRTRPMLGRIFHDGEDQPGATKVA